MKTVTICKGLPASGKSTWSKKMVDTFKFTIKRVNKDELRAMLDNNQWGKDNEKFILALRDYIIDRSLVEGKSVIVDDTNLHPKHETRIRQVVKDYQDRMKKLGKNSDVKIEIREFTTTPEECIKRDLKRHNSVGKDVIMDMYNKFVKPNESKPEPFKQNESLPKAVICDLDGTLCINDGHRGYYDYIKCGEDKLNEKVKDILLRYKNTHHIHFVSGRESYSVVESVKWIEKHLPELGQFSILMRKTGDFRKDCIIKREIFENEISKLFYVDLVLDDRSQVVSMWRELGLTCFQVADGNF